VQVEKYSVLGHDALDEFEQGEGSQRVEYRVRVSETECDWSCTDVYDRFVMLRALRYECTQRESTGKFSRMPRLAFCVVIHGYLTVSKKKKKSIIDNNFTEN
jgi:hypothetical protein